MARKQSRSRRRTRIEVTGLILLDATPTTWPATVCSVAAYEAGCAVMRNPALDPERVDVFPAFEQVATITSLGDLPMTVMTAAHRDGTGLPPGELERLDRCGTRASSVGPGCPRRQMS